MITLDSVASDPLQKEENINLKMAVGYDSAHKLLEEKIWGDTEPLGTSILLNPEREIQEVARIHWNAHMNGRVAGIGRTEKEQAENDKEASRQKPMATHRQ